MASLQEQLKFIRTTNDDWCDEHRRYFPLFFQSSLGTGTNNVYRLVSDLVNLSEKVTGENSHPPTPRSELMLRSGSERSGEASS